MELWHGVLLYEIAKYSGRDSIVLMEMLSSTIQNKLKVNLSSFQYILIKKKLTEHRLNYDQCKIILKSAHPDIYAIESKRFPGRFLEPYQQEDTNLWLIRLKRPSAINKQSNDWGWFRALKFSKDTYAFESKRYSGFFFEAYGLNEENAKIKLTKVNKGDIYKIGRNPQNLFGRALISDNVVSFESKIYPGYFLESHEEPVEFSVFDLYPREKPVELRLWNVGYDRVVRNSWGWFSMKQIPNKNSISS